MVNKEAVILRVNQRMGGFSNHVIRRAIDAFIDEIASCLENGDSVQISGFGTFEVKHRAARVGRNPRTNTEVPIPERNMPVFKPSPALKDRISKIE